MIVTIHTEPRTVLCAFTFDYGCDVASVGSKRARFGRALRTVSDVEHKAGYSLRKSAELTADSPAAMAFLGVVGENVLSLPAERVGTSSAVAAGILLHSEGRCAACRQPIDLDPSSDDLSIHLASEEDFRSNKDWPAALCRKCTAAMDAQSTSSLVDLRKNEYVATLNRRANGSRTQDAWKRPPFGFAAPVVSHGGPTDERDRT